MSDCAVLESGPSTHIKSIVDGQELNLKYSEDGSILFWTDIATAHSRAGAIDSSSRRISIDTTAEDCGWNVYSTKKPLTSYHVQNRPPIVDLSKEGHVVRIGNRIFFLNQLQSSGIYNSFVPLNFSLSINEVMSHGQYLVVTSRQKVAEVPVVERDPPMSEDQVDVEKEKVTDSVEAKAETNKDFEASDARMTTKDRENDTRKAEDSDSQSEPEDDRYEVSNSEDELSAYESWSEGSTDLEEIGVRPVQDLRPELPEAIPDKGWPTNKADRQSKDVRSVDSDSESESTDDGESCGCCHSESESDQSILDNENQRYESHAANDKEEFYEMLDNIFVNDRIERGYDSDSDNDDEEPDGVWEESGWALFGDDDDFDAGFQQFADDTDDCSDCGDDDGSCAISPKEEKSKAKEQENIDPAEPSLGTPLAQIHVYDTSIPTTTDNKPGFKRIFHYQSMVGQPFFSSRPVMHPAKSLLVWPIGDSKIVLADYRHNTYFVKRLRLSRFFSQHISIDCHFSSDSQFLHVMALERHGKPPLSRKKMANLKRLKSKATPKEREVPIYDVVLSTFRLSEGKTARAPPVLVHQVRQTLGPIEEKFALPTFTWDDNDVCVVYAIADRRVRGYRMQLFRTISKQIGPAIRTITGEVQIDLVGAEVAPPESVESTTDAKSSGKGFSINKIVQVRPIYKPESVDRNVTTAEGTVSVDVSKINVV